LGVGDDFLACELQLHDSVEIKGLLSETANGELKFWKTGDVPIRPMLYDEMCAIPLPVPGTLPRCSVHSQQWEETAREG
jgi:hypothetical protein